MSAGPGTVLEAVHLGGTQTDGSCVRDASIRFGADTFHVVSGGSASGRDLLLRLLGLLERSAHGDVLISGDSTSGLDDDARTALRNARFGFVFAAPFLLPTFSAAENVAMPLFKISQVESREARERTEQLLDFTGLDPTAPEHCGKLPLFHQHRVSLARALANQPAVLIVECLAESMNADDRVQFLNLLREAAPRFNTAVIAAMPPGFESEKDDRVVEIVEGVIVRDSLIAKELGA